MSTTSVWLPDDLMEARDDGAKFATYQFNWGVASLDLTEETWIQIIEFKDQMEHLVDYYPRGTTFHVRPEGYHIDMPKAVAFDPVELTTPLQ